MIERLSYKMFTPVTTWRPRPMHNIFDETCTVLFGCFEQPVKRDPLVVIVTIDFYDKPDGDWLHLSVSRARRLPTWGDLVTARDAMGYRELLFTQLLPPASAWLNIHQHVLHLQRRLDANTVPHALYNQLGTTGEAYGEHG
jgi:hypothetical protein